MARSWLLATAFFVLEGVFLTGFALGWGFGIKTELPGYVVAIMAGAGLVSLIFAWWIWNKKYLKIKWRTVPGLALNIDELFEKFPPFHQSMALYDEDNFRAHLLKTDSKNVVTLLQPVKCVIQNLEGTPVEVRSTRHRVQLGAGEIIRINLGPGELWIDSVEASPSRVLLLEFREDLI